MRLCKNCGKRLVKSDNEEYSWQCKNCDEDFYDFETIKDYTHKYMVVDLGKYKKEAYIIYKTVERQLYKNIGITKDLKEVYDYFKEYGVEIIREDLDLGYFDIMYNVLDNNNIQVDVIIMINNFGKKKTVHLSDILGLLINTDEYTISINELEREVIFNEL